MLPVVLLSLLAAFAIGVLLITVGARGRRINDHPICRQCGFDLDGVYPESVTCPECGAGLKREKSVRVGARRRLPWAILAGLLLALAPLPPIAVVTFAALTGSDINSYKPLGLLLWEARHADAARTGKLAGEILNRLMTPNTVSPAQYQKVIESTLALQGDPGMAWSEEWGNIIERAKLDGTLTQAQEDRFTRQAGVLSLKTRGTVHAGQLLPMKIDLREARVATNSAILWGLSFGEASVDGRTLERVVPREPLVSAFGTQAVWRMADPMESQGSDYLGSMTLNGSRAPALWGMGGGAESFLILRLPDDLPPGRHRLKVDLDVETQSASSAGGRAMTIMLGRMQGVAPSSTTRVRLETEVEVAPGDQPLVTAIAPDEKTTAKLIESLDVGTVSVGMPFMSRGDEPATASVDFNVKDLPVPVAFDVYLRAGGREWKLGSIDSGESPKLDTGSVFFSTMTVTINGITRSSSGGGEDRRAVSGELGGDELSVDAAEIVLRPSRKAAEATLDLTSYYNGEVRIPVSLVFGPADPFRTDIFEDARRAIERMRGGAARPTKKPQPGKAPAGPL